MQGLGGQLITVDVNGYLAGAGAKEMALHGHKVTQVEIFFEGIVKLLAQIIFAQINLQATGPVLKVGKRTFAHNPHRHQSPGYLDRKLWFFFRILRQDGLGLIVHGDSSGDGMVADNTGRICGLVAPGKVVKLMQALFNLFAKVSKVIEVWFHSMLLPTS